MEDMLIKFKEVVDEEILAYESLSELYNIKQTILVQRKTDALWDIDAQILAKAEDIKSLSKKRKDVARYLGDENMSMSAVIEKAMVANGSIAGSLQSQKTKLKILAKSLTLQEKTNMTLVKHGLTMVSKTLDIIASAILPQAAGQYDKKGQNIGTDESLLSSVVEEA